MHLNYNKTRIIYTDRYHMDLGRNNYGLTLKVSGYMLNSQQRMCCVDLILHIKPDTTMHIVPTSSNILAK